MSLQVQSKKSKKNALDWHPDIFWYLYGQVNTFLHIVLQVEKNKWYYHANVITKYDHGTMFDLELMSCLPPYILL